MIGIHELLRQIGIISYTDTGDDIEDEDDTSNNIDIADDDYDD